MTETNNVYLNQALVKKQNVSEETQEAIKLITVRLRQVLERPSHYSDDPEVVVSIIEGMEYTLQNLWNFPMDNNYHRYWHRVKGCTCPSMDNDDPIYFGDKIIREGCPYHWPTEAIDEA